MIHLELCICPPESLKSNIHMQMFGNDIFETELKKKALK